MSGATELTVFPVSALAVAVKVRSLLHIASSLPSIPREPYDQGSRGDLSDAWEVWWTGLVEDFGEDPYAVWERPENAPIQPILVRELAVTGFDADSWAKDWQRALPSGVGQGLISLTADLGHARAARRGLQRQFGGKLAARLNVAVVPWERDWSFFLNNRTLLISASLAFDTDATANWLGIR